MKHTALFLSLIACIALGAARTPAAPQTPRQGEHGSGSFVTGSYENLLATHLVKSDAEVQAKIAHAFAQLFHGDPSSQALYFPVGADMAYIEDINNNDVRTEGMSYGMMIAVQLNKKNEFDRLWKWAKTHMQHTSGPHKNFFAWHCRTDGTKIDRNAASDGEEWIVTALFFASARWGNGEGIYNYNREAQTILHTMLHKEEQPGGTDSVTNMFSKQEHQVVFVPGTEGARFTDPSYHLPHFYELWSRWAERDNAFWSEAARVSRSYLKRTVHPATGLAPEYSHFDGRPILPWGTESKDFRFDAWRVAMNVAVDHQWFARDPWAVEQSDRLLTFFAAQGVRSYGNQYTLDGRKLADDHSTGLVAMNAVACLAATTPVRKEFLEDLWNAKVPEGRYRYYDGLLYMLGLLQTSGQFRIYEPSSAASYISVDAGVFTIAASGVAAPLSVSSNEFPGVHRVLSHLQTDIGAVTGVRPVIVTDSVPGTAEIIIAGTIGRNPLIDRLISEHKLDVVGIAGTRESFVMQVVDRPFPNVARALVIAGSDKRGTIFGMYDLSAKIGVSPWYWWADVPIRKHASLYMNTHRVVQREPKVRYRGIFINDEAPALSGLTAEKFGGFNSRFYDHVFELILRLKGNYLWPAMWGRSLFADDSLSAPLADEYGVVLGTSHHEPMVRAHVEWSTPPRGPWSYEKNDSTLREFWREGIRRMGTHETIVTVGMRGDGDEPMTQDANIALLERIVRDQRAIISEVTGKDVSTVPQLWALYKEVQEYFDRGMRVPDDVTLLLCDDNWGNIRKLPKLADKPRTGGYGIYYHFDYVGGPRNYKWVNTNQISRVWEQMHLAYEYGAREIWIVNVGDIKPMEFPTEFFLDYAMDPDAWPAERLPEYTRRWAERQFGPKNVREIAGILTAYTTYNSRRKPELLSSDTYSLTNYREAETVVADYQALASRAQSVYDALSADAKDAYYQLVLHPVLACANLYDLYCTVGRNRLYAEQGRALANMLAARARELFRKDSAISYYYNHIMAGGKWNHMMDQTHIGYTSWQQPEADTMPHVRTVSLPAAADMGVAVEGSASWWPKDTAAACLPRFDRFNEQTYYIDIFNRGSSPFAFTVRASKPWIRLSVPKGRVSIQERVLVSIDWKTVPAGTRDGSVTITGANRKTVTVRIVADNRAIPASAMWRGFVESNNYVSIEASHFTNAVSSASAGWRAIPSLGRSHPASPALPQLAAMTPTPVTAPMQTLGGPSPRLEYSLYLFTAGKASVTVHLSPTLNFNESDGLRYAVSFDDEKPQIVNMHSRSAQSHWDAWVSNNVITCTSTHALAAPGAHVLKFWIVDPGVVLQKIVVETGAVKPSYLGPPESFFYNSASHTSH